LVRVLIQLQVELNLKLDYKIGYCKIINERKKTMNKFNIIASIVEGETLCNFDSLMEDLEFKKLFKAVKNLPLEEATSQLIDKANEIS